RRRGRVRAGEPRARALAGVGPVGRRRLLPPQPTRARGADRRPHPARARGRRAGGARLHQRRDRDRARDLAAHRTQPDDRHPREDRRREPDRADALRAAAALSYALRRVSTRFPAQIPFIIANEGCERFSFYGMRNILTPFLTTVLLLAMPDKA